LGRDKLSTLSSVANPNIDRGNSDFDIRHAFTAGVTYNLPSPQSNAIAHAALGGWSVAKLFGLFFNSPCRNVGFCGVIDQAVVNREDTA
jgi:hypothetical protein